MLRSFLIAVIFSETIALITVLLSPPLPQNWPPNRSGEASEQQPRYNEKIFKIECNPDCHYEAADDNGNDYWQRVETDPVAQFTGVLVIATFILALVGYRTLIHFRTTEKAYVSGGGYFPIEDPSTGWRINEFMLTVDNYGKTPAHVDFVRIGYAPDRNALQEEPNFSVQLPLGMIVPPGIRGLQTDVRIARDQITGTIIFGRFFYEDIFSRRRFRNPRVRYSSFILRIEDDLTVLPVDQHPRTYTDWS